MTIRDLLTSALTYLNSERFKIKKGVSLAQQMEEYTKSPARTIIDTTPASVNIAVALACLEDGHSLDEKLEDIFIPNQETLQK